MLRAQPDLYTESKPDSSKIKRNLPSWSKVLTAFPLFALFFLCAKNKGVISVLACSNSGYYRLSTAVMVSTTDAVMQQCWIWKLSTAAVMSLQTILQYWEHSELVQVLRIKDDWVLTPKHAAEKRADRLQSTTVLWMCLSQSYLEHTAAVATCTRRVQNSKNWHWERSWLGGEWSAGVGAWSACSGREYNHRTSYTSSRSSKVTLTPKIVMPSIHSPLNPLYQNPLNCVSSLTACCVSREILFKTYSKLVAINA